MYLDICLLVERVMQNEKKNVDFMKLLPEEAL